MVLQPLHTFLQNKFEWQLGIIYYKPVFLLTLMIRKLRQNNDYTDMLVSAKIIYINTRKNIYSENQKKYLILEESNFWRKNTLMFKYQNLYLSFMVLYFFLVLFIHKFQVAE